MRPPAPGRRGTTLSHTTTTQGTENGPTTVRAGEEGAAAPVIPATVGPYRILDALGEGGMGVVYRARDPRLGREVAVKLLRSGAGRRGGANERRRLVREARAMAHLAHPNVVEVFDVGTEGTQVFVAMELV